MPETARYIAPPKLLFDGLGHLDQGIAIFDAAYRLVIWNRRFLELRGLPEQMAYVGADLQAMLRYFACRGELGEGDPDVLAAAEMPRPGGNGRRQFERIRADGLVLEVTETQIPEGGISLVYTDVTERRRKEHALIELAEQRAMALELSETRLKLIADEVPAGIAHIDQQMRFIYTNRRFAAAYNFRPEDLVGLSTADVLHPRTLAESARFFEQARRGALVDFEMRIELPGARFKDIRTLLRPAQPSNGEVIGFYLLSIDVTRRKATMSALMGAHKMDALGRMASGISHDFNNLLTVILGNLVPLSENLGESPLVNEYLAPAISAARRGSSLTQRLLTIARREQYAPEPTHIDSAVADICTLLRSSMPRTLQIQHRSGANIPDAMVDRAQLEMALLNLAVNARDATGGNGIFRVEVSRYQLQPSEAELLHIPFGPYVRIVVSDDGCGMTAEQTERIFEPFYTSKAAGAGSGLGLSMVYGLCQAVERGDFGRFRAGCRGDLHHPLAQCRIAGGARSGRSGGRAHDSGRTGAAGRPHAADPFGG
jgi:PAS domain S-box-containing protein